MAENENVLTEAPAPVNPPKGNKKGGKVKEWFRKKVVALKRKPQTIALVVLLVTSVYFLLSLYNVSQAIIKSFGDENTSATGICTFVTTLLSLLVLVSFLNSFPKRKKPNVFFIVLTFVMIAGMIACDVVYYLQMAACLDGIANPESSELFATVNRVQPYLIGHMVLLGVSAVVFALLPVYKRLINKINTKVELESATENMQGSIDIQED